MQTSDQDIGEKMTDSAEIMLDAYAMLRLQPRHWRRLLSSIAGPAFRLHEFRNSSTRIWREALCELECADRGANGRTCHE